MERDIYLYCGHGGDLSADPNILDLKAVPEGSLYVNLGSSGVRNYFNVIDIITFFNDPADTRFSDVNTSRIEEMFPKLGTARIGSIRVYAPNPRDNAGKYVNNIFCPFNIHRSHSHVRGSGFLIGMSGLIKRQLLISKERVIRYTFYDSISLDDLCELFSASVYPTPAEITTYFTEKCPGRLGALTYDDITGGGDLSRSDFNLHVNVLIRRFPGIHYNFTCRDLYRVGRPNVPSPHLRRANSAEAGRSVASQLFVSWRSASFLDFFETVLTFEQRGIPIRASDLEALTGAPILHRDETGLDELCKRSLFHSMVLHPNSPISWGADELSQADKNKLLLEAIINRYKNSMRYFISKGAVFDPANATIVESKLKATHRRNREYLEILESPAARERAARDRAARERAEPASMVVAGAAAARGGAGDREAKPSEINAASVETIRKLLDENAGSSEINAATAATIRMLLEEQEAENRRRIVRNGAPRRNSSRRRHNTSRKTRRHVAKL